MLDENKEALFVLLLFLKLATSRNEAVGFEVSAFVSGHSLASKWRYIFVREEGVTWYHSLRLAIPAINLP